MKFTSSLFVVALVIAFSASPAQDKTRRSSGSGSNRDTSVRSQGNRSSTDRNTSTRSQGSTRGVPDRSMGRTSPPSGGGDRSTARGGGQSLDRPFDRSGMRDQWANSGQRNTGGGTAQGRGSSNQGVRDGGGSNQGRGVGQGRSDGNSGRNTTNQGVRDGGGVNQGRGTAQGRSDGSSGRGVGQRPDSNQGRSGQTRSDGGLRDRPADRNGGRVIIDRNEQNRGGSGRSSAGDRNQRGDNGSGRGTNGFGDRGYSSRSGQVSYGSSHNNSRDGRDKRRMSYNRAPDFITGRSDRRHWTQDRISFWINSGAVRVGYWGYDRSWNDDRFFYPHYVFDPFGGRNCYVSPWYYYPHLPAYVYANRCTIVTNLPGVFIGASYSWNRPRTDGYRADRDYNDLDYALEDLVDTYERGDKRALERLIPRGGSVNIYVDGRYSYTLGADDFEDMLADNMRTTDTERYEIVETRYNREGAQVVARHTFTDSWGGESSVWHTYRLSSERGGAVIREFGTSNHRP